MSKRDSANSDVPRGIEIRRLADGSFAYRVYFRSASGGGRHRQNRQFGRLEHAIAFKARFSRKNGTAAHARSKLKEFAQTRWLPKAEQDQKPSTVASDRSRLDNYILPFFGETYLDTINRAQWEHFATTVTGTDGQQLSGRTKQNLFGLLHTIIQYAVELEMLDKNPIARAPGSRRNLLRPKAQRHEKPVLTPAQFQAILQATKPHWHPLLWTFAITGLRASEVAGLKWCDYDEGRRELSIRRGVVRRVVGTPKTEATIRRVGVSVRLAKQLADQRYYQTGRRKGVPTADDFIFCAATGRAFDNNRIRHEVLYPALNRAGIQVQPRDYGWHIFRHSAVTAHLAQTGDIYRASKYAGHASVNTTANTYAHVKPAMIEDAELVDRYWGIDENQSSNCGSNANSNPARTKQEEPRSPLALASRAAKKSPRHPLENPPVLPSRLLN